MTAIIIVIVIAGVTFYIVKCLACWANIQLIDRANLH